MTNLRKAYLLCEYLVLENAQNRRVDSVNLIFCPESTHTCDLPLIFHLC